MSAIDRTGVSLTDSSWNYAEAKEPLIHKIHPYPAKFPAFITTNALKYAESRGVSVRTIADVFCGCGTTAVEAQRLGKDFWGCDINPLAALIAQVKPHPYKDGSLKKNADAIRQQFDQAKVTQDDRATIMDRIWYWFDKKNVDDLIKLDRAIRQCTRPYSPHRKFFQCGFSAILKATSFWLTKSIKSQKDPSKTPMAVMEAFERQVSRMRRANAENDLEYPLPKTTIRVRNFLGRTQHETTADLIVTSPPYVTSYDYADIHQLSTLWLGYASDYRELNVNMLGNTHGVRPWQHQQINQLGEEARQTYRTMLEVDARRAASIAKYFVDLNIAVRRCWGMLEFGGMAVFVIGNTEYKGVKVDNALNMERSMDRAGFSHIEKVQRKVSSKTMTPYRDKKGRFTRDASERQVYAKEWVLIGEKPRRMKN